MIYYWFNYCTLAVITRESRGLHPLEVQKRRPPQGQHPRQPSIPPLSVSLLLPPFPRSLGSAAAPFSRLGFDPPPPRAMDDDEMWNLPDLDAIDWDGLNRVNMLLEQLHGPVALHATQPRAPQQLGCLVLRLGHLTLSCQGIRMFSMKGSAISVL